GRARARRLGDHLHLALGDRGARDGHRADAPDADGRPHDPPDRAPVPLGQARPDHRRLGERPRAHGARPERPHPGGQGVHVRDPARPAAARARAAEVRRRAARAGALKAGSIGGRAADARPGKFPAAFRDRQAARGRSAGRAGGGAQDVSTPDGLLTYGDEQKERVGFFTDTSVCIGCKACEVACKEWNLIPEEGRVWTGESYDNTSELNANTWRHVAFVEQEKPLVANGDGETGLRWLMESDVCKHCTHAACLDVCPTGALFRTEFGT